jgi:hypothetical protein
MNRLSPLAFGVLSSVLVLSASPSRADDPANPPAPPAAPANPPAPADADQPPPPPAPPAPHHGHMRPAYSLDDLTQKLTLTADQQKTIGPVIDDANAQAKAVRGDDSLSQDDRREKMRSIMKAERDSIRAALTADQQKIFDALPGPGGHRKKPDGN